MSLRRRCWTSWRTRCADKFGVEPSDLPLLAAYRDRADVMQPMPLPGPVCCDADDDRVLATAVAGQADVIVSGDADLLTLAAAFLEINGWRFTADEADAVIQMLALATGALAEAGYADWLAANSNPI